MKWKVLLAPDAVEDLGKLRAYDRAQIRDVLEGLRVAPTHVSRSRIKRLRGLQRPQYRLRVGGIRVFYDASQNEIHVLAIVSKEEAQAWLDREGQKH